MLQQLEVFSPGIAAPPLPIGAGDANADMIQIHHIDGLEPVKAAVNTAAYGSIDGEFFTGASVGKRNIVLYVGLRPDWSSQSMESLRLALYQYFMPKQTVRLRFTSTHMVPVEIVGIVESITPDMFSADPEYQVSIICPDPYFNAGAAGTGAMTTLFADDTEVSLVYSGSAPSGFTVDVSVNPDAGVNAYSGEVRIVNMTDVTRLLSVIVDIDATHTVQVSTVQGNKYARRYNTVDGTFTNILGKVVPGSDWDLILRQGQNNIKVQTTTQDLLWTLHYVERYGGL